MTYDSKGGLGRRKPPDFEHIDKYPLKSLGIPAVFTVEKSLLLPPWHKTHNQGQEGACVGFGTSMMLTITNLHESAKAGIDPLPNFHYNPWWLWDRSKEVDGFSDTKPGDNNGTTVRAALDTLKKRGHVRWKDERTRNSIILPPRRDDKILSYKWATTIDEVRTSINNAVPLSIGVNWYSNFDNPQYSQGEYWIGKGNLGTLRGGHCLTIYGASDHRQAVKLKNSWGTAYPEVWMPYSTLLRLLKEDGEIGLIADYINPVKTIK